MALSVASSGQHAFLAPSSAHRWGYCSGSAWMESQFPDLQDDEARNLGTGAHWVAQFALAGTPLAEGSLTPNGVAVDRTMRQASALLTCDVEAKLIPYFGDAWRSACKIEHRVDIPLVHPSHNWGTPDVRAWATTSSGQWVLHIWDYKYGYSPVEAFANPQLIDYAAGCLTEAKTLWPAFDEARCTIVLTVVQPRAYHADGPVRTWETTATQLAPYIHSLAMAAEEAASPAPLCRPRPDVCHDCRARSGCKALQDAVYMGLTMATIATPRVMTDEGLGLEMAMLEDALELMRARYTGLEELVKARLRAGARIPHWMYGAGRGKLAWTRPASEVIALGDLLGLPLAKPPEAITPTQAKALGLQSELLDTYAGYLAGATKLMRDDGSAARKIFSITPLPE